MANELNNEMSAMVKLAPYLVRWSAPFVAGHTVIWEDYEWDTYATIIVELNWMSPVTPDKDGRMCIMKHNAHIRIEDGRMELEYNSFDERRLTDVCGYSESVGICGDWEGIVPPEFVAFMDAHFRREEGNGNS